jgi:hypothetical protein
MAKRYTNKDREIQATQAVLDRAIYTSSKEAVVTPQPPKTKTAKETAKEKEAIEASKRQARINKLLKRDQDLIEEQYRGDLITHYGEAINTLYNNCEAIETDPIKQVVNALPTILRQQAREVHGEDWRDRLEEGLNSVATLIIEEQVAKSKPSQTIAFAELSEDEISAKAWLNYLAGADSPKEQFKSMRAEQRQILAQLKYASDYKANNKALSNLHIAIFSEDQIRAAATTASLIARAEDGYSEREPSGRPQHDWRWQCRQLRETQKEILALIESASKLNGGGKNQSKYAGKCSQNLRKLERERKDEWEKNSTLEIPLATPYWKKIDGVDMLIKTVSIPLNLGNNRHKSLSEFYGFVKAIQILAEREGRRWCLTTLTAPSEMHIGSNSWNGKDTPRTANKWLSATKKAVSDTLRDWGCKIAGVGTRESHKSGTPHAHFAIAYDCKKKAIKQIKSLHKFCGRRALSISKKPLHENWEEDFEFLGGQSPERLIKQHEDAIYQCAWEIHSYDLERDDNTGRLVMDIKDGITSGVGVDIRLGKTSEESAKFASYAMTYIMKSFGVDTDKLPSKDDPIAHEKAKREMIEAGGDLAIDTWRSSHRIRTREIFGLPSRTPFKMLRKLIKPIAYKGLEKARKMAYDSDHVGYIDLQGGLNGTRNEAKLRTVRIERESNYALRPDLKRSVIIGLRLMQQTYKSVSVCNMPTWKTTGMHEVEFIKTKIEGVTIKTIMQVKDVNVDLKAKIKANRKRKPSELEIRLEKGFERYKNLKVLTKITENHNLGKNDKNSRTYPKLSKKNLTAVKNGRNSQSRFRFRPEIRHKPPASECLKAKLNNIKRHNAQNVAKAHRLADQEAKADTFMASIKALGRSHISTQAERCW